MSQHVYHVYILKNYAIFQSVNSPLLFKILDNAGLHLGQSFQEWTKAAFHKFYLVHSWILYPILYWIMGCINIAENLKISKTAISNISKDAKNWQRNY